MSAGVLIAGLGQIGMGYDLGLDPAYVYSHARAFSQHPQFHLLGGIDPDGHIRERFAGAYGCPVYADVATALEHHQPEVVVVAVPTRLHGQTLRQVLERSQPRIVLCEKPLSYDVAEANGMVQACADRGVGLYVNYIRRSDPGVIEVKRRIDAGELGAPIKGVVWYSKGFVHNGSHYFNLLEYWLGPMRDGAVVNPGRPCGDADSEPDVHVAFEKGDAVFLAAWEEAFSHCTVELLSPGGRLRYERDGRCIEWQPAAQGANSAAASQLSAVFERIPSGLDRYQWQVTEQLARALRNDECHLCTGDDALRTLSAMSSILTGSHAPSRPART